VQKEERNQHFSVVFSAATVIQCDWKGTPVERFNLIWGREKYVVRDGRITLSSGLNSVILQQF